MQPPFDPGQFISRLGEDLVRDFESARQATTPGMTGSAAETPVRRKLENLLPKGIGVGSGCIIDTYGNTSRQIDVVLFEKDICPVFSLNDTPETTYYPCEGVIAAGEVKSVLNKTDIEDSFEKISSVKSLKRNFDKPLAPAHPETGGKVYTPRRYGQTHSGSILQMDYDPFTDEYSEIFGFVLAGRIGVTAETMHGHIVRLVNDTDESLCPNIVVSMSGPVSVPTIRRRLSSPERKAEFAFSARSANSVGTYANDCPFGMLIRWLYLAYRNGKTSCIEVFDNYLQAGAGNRPLQTDLVQGRDYQGPAPIVRGLK